MEKYPPCICSPSGPDESCQSPAHFSFSPEPNSPFIVPGFSAQWSKPEIRFFWWSWHPNYPSWSKSCWGGKTEDEAWAELSKPFASELSYYHNKLIREGDGAFTEVADLPCRKMDAWRKIAAKQMEKLLSNDNGGCLPNCGHSEAEHAAFDRGVSDGLAVGIEAENPFDSKNSYAEWDAWETGKSVGAQQHRP